MMTNSKERLNYISDAITRITEVAKEHGLESATADMMIACASFLDHAAVDDAKCVREMSDIPFIDKAPVHDNVNHPDHYNQMDYEVIDIIEMYLGTDGARQFCLGNFLKYVLRNGHKPGATDDLEKANWYLRKAEELSLFGRSDHHA